MLLGFQRQFAEYVEEGSKTHTIRAKRAQTPRVGETCHCYANPRQKNMRLLGRFECVGVQAIRICPSFLDGMPLIVYLDEQILGIDETREFFWRDGFRDGLRSLAPLRAAAFWERTHGIKPGTAWEGILIHWRFEEGTCKSKPGRSTKSSHTPKTRAK
jgi:hypothetical protein